MRPPSLCRNKSEAMEYVEQPLSRGGPTLTRSVAIVATCTGAMLVHTMNIVSVSISLPWIGKTVDIQEDQVQWLLSAYSLSSGCLLLFFARLADLYGRKKGFLIGMLWQTVLALGLGYSSDGPTLIVLRGLQGMGAAAAIPSAVGILANSFPPSRARSIAFATFGAGSPIGGAFGTIVGGLLTQFSKEHWRTPFFLSTALSGLCVFGAIISFVPDYISSEVDTRVDWIGALLVTNGLVLVIFALSQGTIIGWKTPYLVVCLVIGVLFVAIFIAWEYWLERSANDSTKPKSFWTPPPLMKLSIWARANGRMAVIFVTAFLTWCGFISWMFWVQLYYQNYLGLTPVGTMIRFVPMFVMGFLCNFFVAVMVSKFRLVVLTVLGTLITGFACVLFAVIDPSATYWAFGFPSTAMIVFGADFVYTAGTIFIAQVVLPHEQSLASGIFQTMAQIGTAFGLAISTIAFNSVVVTQLAANRAGTNASTTSGELQGYRAAQWTNAAFPLFASLLAVIFLRKLGVVGDSKYSQQDTPKQGLIISEQEIGVMVDEAQGFSSRELELPGSNQTK